LNASTVNDFIQTVNGQMFDISVALDYLEKPHAKIVRPVTVFRGNLTLGDTEESPDTSLSIAVHVFNKVTEFKVPSAKKRNPRTVEGPVPDHSILMEREYVYKQTDEELDEAPPELSKDDLVRAYAFGRKLIPCYPEDEEAWKLKTEKGLCILGFIDLSDLPRHDLTGGILLVVPEPYNVRALESFSVLMAGLREKNAGALVRYCRIKDATPKLGIMICSPKGQGLVCTVRNFKDRVTG
jgi:ATP-dependent DNA helicase 2 subunit 2